MIANQMKKLPYYRYETVTDEYGQDILNSEPKGTVNIAINLISQEVVDKINYKDASYIGLTFDSNIDDSCVIQLGNMKLKVLYVNPFGRYKQVFMEKI